MKKTITVEMDSAAGPRVTFRGDVDGERLRAAAPVGYQVVWGGPMQRLGRGRFALPLVLEQPIVRVAS